jgi:hypothetical protein
LQEALGFLVSDMHVSHDVPTDSMSAAEMEEHSVSEQPQVEKRNDCGEAKWRTVKAEQEEQANILKKTAF